MAQHGLRRREDGRLVPKLDPALRGVGRPRAGSAVPEPDLVRAQWDALARIPCPTLVVRGAASDVLSADVAERMAEEVLPKGALAVIARAGHSVMTDNPDGFRDAVLGFVLGEG
jgi:pimeloyl-ACP methyl ester carboxylesterase